MKKLPRHVGGADEGEKHVPTLGCATVALEGAFSRFVVTERRIIVIGEHG